jgi:hypothetical protein
MGHLTEIRTHDTDDRIRVGVRLVMHRGQHGHPRTRHPQSNPAQHALEVRRRSHTPKSGLSFSNQSSIRRRPPPGCPSSTSPAVTSKIADSHNADRCGPRHRPTGAGGQDRGQGQLERLLRPARPDRCQAISDVVCDSAGWISDVVATYCPVAVRCADPFHVVTRATDVSPGTPPPTEAVEALDRRIS